MTYLKISLDFKVTNKTIVIVIARHDMCKVRVHMHLYVTIEECFHES